MYRVYQIQSNETLESIAQKLNTTADVLKRLNGIRDDILLKTGSFIIVPMVDDRFKIYIVKQGDTIYSIARDNNLDYDLLLKINGLNKEDYIYPNQEIVIPSKEYKYYMTKEGDTLKKVVDNLKVNFSDLIDNNEILLEKEQLILYK